MGRLIREQRWEDANDLLVVLNEAHPTTGTRVAAMHMARPHAERLPYLDTFWESTALELAIEHGPEAVQQTRDEIEAFYLYPGCTPEAFQARAAMLQAKRSGADA